MKYKVCEYCGAHLDFGEVCDCKKRKSHSADKQMSDLEKNIQLNYNGNEGGSQYERL